MECQPQETAVLIIDGPYAQSLTAGDNGRPRTTLDYMQFIDWCFTSAGLAQRGHTYYRAQRPWVSLERAGSREANLALYRQHTFHDALRGPDVQVEVYDNIKGAISALIAKLLISRQDITHYILVSADSALSPTVIVARTQGVYITLIHQEERDFSLQHSCDTDQFITTDDLVRMTYTKVASDQYRTR